MDAVQQTHGACETLRSLEEGLHGLEDELHGLEEELHGLEEGLHGLEDELHSMEVQEQVARPPHGHLELIRQPVHCLSLFGQAPTNATLHSWLDVPANRCVRRNTRIDLAGVFRPGQPRPNVSRSASGWSVHHG